MIMPCSSYRRSGKLGRAVVVAEEIEAEGQLRSSANRTTSATPRALRLVMVMDRCGAWPCSISWRDRALDEVKGRLAARERALGVMLVTEAVQRDHYPDALGLERLDQRRGSETPLLSSVACNCRPLAAASSLAWACSSQHQPVVEARLAAGVLQLDRREAMLSRRPEHRLHRGAADGSSIPSVDLCT